MVQAVQMPGSGRRKTPDDTMWLEVVPDDKAAVV